MAAEVVHTASIQAGSHASLEPVHHAHAYALIGYRAKQSRTEKLASYWCNVFHSHILFIYTVFH